MRPYFKPIFLTASLFLILLFIVAKSPARAGAAHFPTIEEVQQMIASALSPIQSSIQGLSNRVSNLETTVTPIPSEIAGLQATLTPIPGQIVALQNAPGKSLHVLDANNQDLGLYMSDNTANITTVFIPSLNRRATIVQNGLDRNALFYNSSDCTGTPYLYIANDDNHVIDIYSIGPGVYYEVKTGTSPITINSHSTYRYNQNTNLFECPAITQQISNAAYEAVQINLPFTEPIATPLQFRYQ
ncbi:MAG TPA: hypothetical protein VEP90_13235 [Methylomirabilota bacterium]|nr:hypothetical protein [Methylomirabilota bacterium]